MAIISFLFSLLVRQANNIIQAIFGWSVSALFGKLPRRAQVLVTAALVVSIAWPLFVLGAFLPGVAAWVIAFIPLHKLMGATALRIAWITLALLAPLLVGLLVHLAAPNTKGSLPRTLINGYPMALGFACAFVIVAVTVPIIKIASLVRRWSDEHVYVQPHDGKYEEVVQQLADAVRRAGLAATISDVPPHMVLATTVIHKLSRGAVASFVSTKLRRITAPGLELYLYPADLLLRGRAHEVARVRSMFARTKLDAVAYLVASPDAQSVQDQLGRLTEAVDHEVGRAVLATELTDTYSRIMNLDIPYDEWVLVEAMARRVERRLIVAGYADPKSLPLDQAAHRARAQQAHEDARDAAAVRPGKVPGPSDTVPTWH